MNLNVASHIDRPCASVVVEGEVDVSNATALRAAIDEVLTVEGVESIDVDMSGVPYIDSTGIGVLVGSAHKAHDNGMAFVLVGAQDNVIRILGMLGIDEVINVK